MQSVTLVSMQEILVENGHTFKTLQKLSEADLEKLGIKAGIAMQLKAYIDLFKRKTLNHT